MKNKTLRSIFPEMSDRPETSHVISIFIYWFLCFVMIPFAIPLAAHGLPSDSAAIAGLDCGYYAVNSILLALIMRKHLAGSFMNVQLNPKKFAGTVSVTCLLMTAAAAAGGLICLLVAGNADRVLSAFPMTEMRMLLAPGDTVERLPFVGTVCMTLFPPISISCLFYAAGFAPRCCKAAWQGYLTVSLVLLALPVFNFAWRSELVPVMAVYALRLPVHLLACWSYQKSNTIWAPAASLAIFNLIASLARILIF